MSLVEYYGMYVFVTVCILRLYLSSIYGIETVIKFITSNLDAKDGKRYDEAIKRLSKTMHLPNTILEEQIEILNHTNTIFNINI